MHRKEEIKLWVRRGFPILFGYESFVDSDDFTAKYDSLNDSASTASAPYLASETVRYQTILLVYSVLLASASLLRIKGIKVFETVVSFNHRLRLSYTVFIAFVAVVFLIKVWSDIRRSQFTRKKTNRAVAELTRLIELGNLRKNIQHDFWVDLSEAIGRSFKVYMDARSEAANKQESLERREMKKFPLVDLEKGREVSELAAEIEKQEQNFTRLNNLLSLDENKFKRKAAAILDTHRAAPKDELYFMQSDTYDDLKSAYDDTIGPWIDGRSELTKEVLDLSLQSNREYRLLEAIVNMWKELQLIRWVYVVLEIVAPLAFATIVSWYVLSH
jgi:hypothetical protein